MAELAARRGPAALAGRLGALRFRWLLALSAAFAVVVGAYVYVLLPLRFTTSSSVLISRSLNALAALGLPVQTRQDEEAVADRIRRIVASDRIVDEVVRQTDFARRLALEPEPAGKLLRDLTRTDTAALAGVVKISVTCNSRCRLAVWTQRPGGLSSKAARDLSAELANAYVAALGSFFAQDAAVESEFLGQRCREAQASLERAELALTEFLGQSRAPDAANMVGKTMEARLRMETALATATAAQQAARATAGKLQGQLGASQTQRLTAAVAARNATLTQLAGRRADLEVARLAAVSGGQRPEHSEVQDLDAEIAAVRTEIGKVSGLVQSSITYGADPLRQELLSRAAQAAVAEQVAGVQVAAYRRLLSQATAREQALPPQLARYARLYREREFQSQLYLGLRRNWELAVLAERRAARAQFSVLDPARPPLYKSGPSTVRDTVCAFILCLLVLSLLRARHLGIFRPQDPV